MNNLIVKDFFDTDTSTMSYVVYDSQTKDAIVIDTVLDYDPLVSKFHTSSVEKIISFIKNEALKLHLILETHAHADHLTASQEVKKVFPDAQIAIGERIREVQESFRDVYNLKNFNINGIQFDRLFEDNEKVEAGSLSFQVIFTPGHTPACVSYFFENFALFTGDALFMPDMGTGRCDFPKGSAEDLYHLSLIHI